MCLQANSLIDGEELHALTHPYQKPIKEGLDRFVQLEPYREAVNSMLYHVFRPHRSKPLYETHGLIIAFDFEPTEKHLKNQFVLRTGQ